MSNSGPALDFLGALLMEQVRDRAIRDIDRLLTNQSSGAVIARTIRELLSPLNAEQLESINRLIPIVVDTTLHHLLWTIEQWDSVRVAVQTEHTTVDDIRNLTEGELEGYLYDWIPRFSKERYEPII